MLAFSPVTGFSGHIDHMYFFTSSVVIVLALSAITSVILGLKLFKRI